MEHALARKASLGSREIHERLVIVFPKTKQELETAYKMRYKAYAIERGWESENPRGQESDRFDTRAQHVLVWDTHIGEYVATARLIPSASRENPDIPFCHVVSNWSDVPIDWAQAEEVSRFTCLKRFTCGLNHKDRALVLMYLIEAVASVSVGRVVILASPGLLRIFGAINMHFDKLGPLIDHHGPRQPAYLTQSTREVASGIRHRSLDLELLPFTYVGRG